MTTGLRIRHPQTGAVIFDTTTITGHSRAALTTTTSAGSLSVAAMLRGSPFIIQALPASSGSSWDVPEFTISGSTLSWTGAARTMRVLLGSRAVGSALGSGQVVGLVLRRPSGQLQLGSVDQTLQLASIGSVVLTDDGGAHPQPMMSGSITVSGANPVVAFRGQEGARINVERVALSGGSYTFTFTCRSNQPVALIYWVFDATSQAMMLNVDVGLVLRDPTAGGVKTFDSRAFAMNLVDVVESDDGESQTVSRSGRVLAAIQSTPGYYLGSQDLGGYSSEPSPPPQAEPGDPVWPRPPGTLWAYMEQFAFHASAISLANGALVVGSTQFESYESWQSSSAVPFETSNGRVRHAIVDVTGLPAATMPTPTVVAVSVNFTTREVSVQSASAATTTTPTSTATASGGSAPYSYLWEYVDGSTSVVANGSTGQAGFSTRVVSQAVGTTVTARWRCRATDALGRVGYSDPVTFRHIVVALDLTPDPITSLPSVSGVSNAADATFGWDYRRITGITGPITIRVERYSFSGTADIAELIGVRSPDASAWTNFGPVNAKGSGVAYVDMTVNNGDYIGWKIRVATSSGRKTAGMQVVVWNRSDPSGPVIISNTPTNNMVVDDDDNFNVDQTPNAISLSDEAAVFNTTAAYSAGNFFTISGINRPITLRFTRDSLTEEGLVPTRRTVIGKSTNGGASYSETNLGAAAGQFVDLTANDGDRFFIKGYVTTDGGRAWARWRNIVTNLTLGQVLGSAFVQITVANNS